MKERDATPQISFEKILFATDFSKSSRATLPYALSVAKKYSSRVFVAHVMAYPPPSSRGSWDVMMAKAEHDANEAISQVVAQLGGVSYEVLLLKGNVRIILSEIIEANQIDLVVMGTHGYTGLRKLVLGSVAEQVFRHAACPVLTVGPNVSAGPEAVAKIHEILYATDFTPDSLTAVPYAISLAQENQAHLSLLHVMEDPEESTSPDLFTHRMYSLVPYKAGLLCRPTAFAKYGTAVEQILDLAHQRAADLIVLGVKHAERFPSASTHLPWAKAHRIVTQAHCPVLTIRAK